MLQMCKIKPNPKSFGKLTESIVVLWQDAIIATSYFFDISSPLDIPEWTLTILLQGGSVVGTTATKTV